MLQQHKPTCFTTAVKWGNSGSAEICCFTSFLLWFDFQLKHIFFSHFFSETEITVCFIANTVPAGTALYLIVDTWRKTYILFFCAFISLTNQPSGEETLDSIELNATRGKGIQSHLRRADIQMIRKHNRYVILVFLTSAALFRTAEALVRYLNNHCFTSSSTSPQCRQAAAANFHSAASEVITWTLLTTSVEPPLVCTLLRLRRGKREVASELETGHFKLAEMCGFETSHASFLRKNWHVNQTLTLKTNPRVLEYDCMWPSVLLQHKTVSLSRLSQSVV